MTVKCISVFVFIRHIVQSYVPRIFGLLLRQPISVPIVTGVVVLVDHFSGGELLLSSNLQLSVDGGFRVQKLPFPSAGPELKVNLSPSSTEFAVQLNMSNWILENQISSNGDRLTNNFKWRLKRVPFSFKSLNAVYLTHSVVLLFFLFPNNQ